MATWPTTLPQCPLNQGYKENIGSLIIRSGMDAGPAKMRRRGNRPQTMSLKFSMNQTQIDTLDTFINDTIKAVGRFDFTHPRKGSLVSVRFIPGQSGELYTIDYVNYDIWFVSMDFEVLP